MAKPVFFGSCFFSNVWNDTVERFRNPTRSPVGWLVVYPMICRAFIHSQVGGLGFQPSTVGRPGCRRFWRLPWPFVWAACTGTSSVGEPPEIGFFGSSQNARVQHPRYGYSGRYQFQLSSTTRMFPLYRSRFASST